MEKNPNLKDKDEAAEMVGVGAIIFNDLMNDLVQDIVFDWDRALNFEGDTGAYVQYSHARICSIIRKADDMPLMNDVDLNEISKFYKDPNEFAILKMLSRFPEIVKMSCEKLKPSLIARYLLGISGSS